MRNFSKDTEHDAVYDYYILDWTGNDEPFNDLSKYMDKESEEVARYYIDEIRRRAEEKGMAPEDYIERKISSTSDTEQKIYKIYLNIFNGRVENVLGWIPLLKTIYKK